MTLSSAAGSGRPAMPALARRVDAARLGLFAILALSLALNLCGIKWGLPSIWHPDERVNELLALVKGLTFKDLSAVNNPLRLYVLGIVLAPCYLFLFLRGALPASWRVAGPSFITMTWMVARVCSALLGTGVVYLSYRLSRRICHGREGTALVGALLAALSMGLTNIAHFATWDIFLVFLATLSLLALCDVMEAGQMRHYLRAGAAIGLAMSAKPTGVLLLFPLLAAHLVGQGQPGGRVAKGSWRTLIDPRLLAGLGVGLVAFVALNPRCWSLSSLYGYVSELLLYAARDIDVFHGQWAFANSLPNALTNLFNLLNALGAPLFLLCAAGLTYGLWSGLRRRDRYALLLLSWVLPYYAVAGVTRIFLMPMRETIPLVPALVALAARLVDAMLMAGRGLRRLGTVVLVGVIAFSLVYTVASDVLIACDSRYAASDWVARNLGEHSTVMALGHPGYLPNLPPKPRTYAPGLSYRVPDLAAMRPDYVVITSFFYARFFADPRAIPEMTAFYRDLIDGKLGYRRVARFPAWGRELPEPYPPMPAALYAPSGVCPWLSPHPEVVNPTILIFRREEQ